MAVMTILPYMNVFANQASMDPSFDTGTPIGFNWSVKSMVTQDDGKIIFGWTFSTYKWISIHHIIRLNTDWTMDSSFDIWSWFNNDVNSIVIQNDGKILVWGVFTSYRWVSANHIIRLNTDGTIDTSFVIWNGFDYPVIIITIQNDGKILAGGNFSYYDNWSATNGIIRLNTNGQKDTSFHIWDWFNNIVTNIVIQQNGEILVAGTFSSYDNGATTNGIVRLHTDGTQDTEFNDNNGFETISAITIQQDGKILVAGNFTEHVDYGSTCADGEINIDQSSCEWSGYCSNGGYSNQNSCESHYTCSDSSYSNKTDCEGAGSCDGAGYINNQADCENHYTCSDHRFTSQQSCLGAGTCSNALYDNNQTGCESHYTCLEDPSITTQTGCENAGYCSDGNYYPDQTSCESHYTCSDYDYNNQTDCEAEWNTWDQNTRSINWFTWSQNTRYSDQNSWDPSSWETNWNTWNQNYRTNFWFTRASGMNITRHKIIRLNTDGTQDDSFNNWDWFDDIATSIMEQNDGKILVWWNFTTYNSVTANRIIRLNADGSRDDSFSIGSWFDYAITTRDPNISFLIQDDGKIMVWWNFLTYNSDTANHIIVLHMDWTKYSSSDPWDGFDRPVDIVMTQNDGKILAGGAFTSYKSISANRIIRLNVDGSRDNSFSIGSWFNGTVNNIAVQGDGKILAGGAFTSYKSISANHIIRLNADGSIDSSFHIWSWFNGTVNNIAVQGDGKILAGGEFTGYTWISTNRIIRLNTDWTIDNSFAIWNGFDDNVHVILLQWDGKLLVWWIFSSYKAVAANKILRLNSDGSRDTWFNNVIFWNRTIDYYDILSLGLQNNGKIIVGGYTESSTNGIIRLNSDWTKDTSFSPTPINTSYNIIPTLVVQSDDKIIMCDRQVRNGISKKFMQRLHSDWSDDTSFDEVNWFDGNINSIKINANGEIIVGGDFTNYNWSAAWYLTILYGDTDTVSLPNSHDMNTVNTAFINKWYTFDDGNLIGTTPISLDETDGNIPITLNLKNNNIKVSIPEDTQFKELDNTTNYDGILSVPIIRSINSINNEEVITMFKVGWGSDAIRMTWWLATLSVPIPDASVWDVVHVYYSEDNGVSRYPQTTTVIISNNNGDPYITFTTNHFTEFAITIPTEWEIFTSWSFSINNNAATTTSNSVTLNLTSSPEATQMRFSNNNITRSAREPYATTKTWTLSEWYGPKTVYAQLDANNDTITDLSISDTITYQSTVNNDTWTNNVWTNNWWGGGGWGTSVKDQCPTNRDCSDSYYDQLCGKCSVVQKIVNKLPFIDSITNNKLTASIANSPYSAELNAAYLRAYSYNITTMPTIQQANLQWPLLRKDMAKMISNFAINILGKSVSTGANCSFNDMQTLSKEAQYYAMAACRLWLMGYANDGVTMNKNFNPDQTVDRAQFWTILSRLLRGTENNGGATYYANHLTALKVTWIMTNISTPNAKELRGRVMLMMQRVFNMK